MTEDLLTRIQGQLQERMEELRGAVEERDRVARRQRLPSSLSAIVDGCWGPE